MGIITPEQQYLIHLLSSVLHNSQPCNHPEKIDWEKLYKLSFIHGVANMAFYAINRLNADKKPPQEIMEKFQNEYKKAIAKEATQHITVEQILKLFEEKGITCMPLKGYLIKYMYSKPDMRLMADIDILINYKQTGQIEKLMAEMGFTLERKGANHDVYYKQPFMNIEMHRRLVSEDSPYSAYLSKTWDRAVLMEGCKFTWKLSPEDLYIYLLIHLTKHYLNGGTGIRSFMDIWVFINRYDKELNWDYIRSELEQIKLLEFAENITGLCKMWFENGKNNEFCEGIYKGNKSCEDDKLCQGNKLYEKKQLEKKQLYEEMAAYILSSGAYGTRKHSVVSSLNASATHDVNLGVLKKLYKLRMFFPGLKHMKVLYPFLGKLPILLPLCWILRGTKCLLYKPRYTFQKIKTIDTVSMEDIDKIRRLNKKAGITK